ncbi:MAG: YigZ family protein [Saprospiraceae bacterium]|nr:YigZ family protein [Saprospiraceae bacterium]
MDYYFTVEREAVGEYKEKGSKFLAYVFPMEEESMLHGYLTNVKNEHPKARHFCYAYRLKIKGEIYRLNDDGEPSGTAGKPIFGQILSFSLSDVLVVVVRYFGGTKLGASGLIQAYKSATEDGLLQAGQKIKYVCRKFDLTFPVSEMGHVFHVLKSNGVEVGETHFGEVNKLSFLIRLSLVDSILTGLKAGLLKVSLDQAKNTDGWGNFIVQEEENVIQ